MYLLDTDTVNYLLKDRPLVSEHFHAAVLAGDDFILSPVVHYEVTRYLRLRGMRGAARAYANLIAAWGKMDLAGDDWDLAADLWADRHRAGRLIEDSDLLIAVCALRTGAVLVTNNGDHFEGLGLNIENWARE